MRTLVGHGFDGRRPVFLDDTARLIIGPLFIVATIAFAMSLRTRTCTRDVIVARLAGDTAG